MTPEKIARIMELPEEMRDAGGLEGFLAARDIHDDDDSAEQIRASVRKLPEEEMASPNHVS